MTVKSQTQQAARSRDTSSAPQVSGALLNSGAAHKPKAVAKRRKPALSKGGPTIKPKFVSPDNFLGELRGRVDNYFATTGLPRRDCPAMYRKTAVIMLWYVATYVTLVFFTTSVWAAIPLAIMLGVVLAAIGFNIQHDGGHNGYSERSWVNRLAAMTMDMLGASSYIWHQQHNVVHHSYANIHEHDADIDVGVFGRMCPSQKRYWFHRWQHIYLWALYTLIAIKWQFYDDFRDCIKGRICGHRFQRPRGKELAVLVGGKLFFVTVAFVIPMLLHGPLVALSFYLLATLVQGVIMAVVIQLAHAVEDVEFPLPADDGRMGSSWAVHQVLTTVDFARDSRIVSWYTGGLNFQTVHHLFPRVCHVNYPALSKIVEETCQEFGLPYREHRTFWAGMVSHYRWLRTMGQKNSESHEAQPVATSRVNDRPAATCPEPAAIALRT